ncbi:glutathione S-transferase [Leptolyngbya sp. 'hensonii']|uniref:glutathione S-transferase family protein n=1 Tax=Leptolyngbya sp. 'hensonii' TaxID=1922337 RepID=UPI00094FA688|nr:glutathione S-transferase family protein [Leptolyngbya sp. 'hensonii']OLP20378.1 glutathione S-transferase [Leptolyngbya sp. 'hensonii']
MDPFTLIIGNKNYSSWSLRPWLVMQHFGIEFKEIRIPLNTPQSRQQISQYSPAKRVPVLQHGSLTIWDSLAICEYLAERFPQAGLYPADPNQRAIARSISAEMHAGFVELRTQMPMDCRSRYPGQGMTPAVQDDIDRITTIWQDCRQRFGGAGDFLFGPFTIADAMYAPVVSRFVTYGVSLPPVAQTYAHTIWTLPAMEQWLAAATAEAEVIPQAFLGVTGPLLND